LSRLKRITIEYDDGLILYVEDDDAEKFSEIVNRALFETYGLNAPLTKWKRGRIFTYKLQKSSNKDA